MTDYILPKCLKGKTPADLYLLAHSAFVGRPTDRMPTRQEIFARQKGCLTSPSGYSVCLSSPKKGMTEGTVSYSAMGPFLFDRYTLDLEDAKLGKAMLEVRREWGQVMPFKTYSLYLWDGARNLLATTQDTWFGNWGDWVGNSAALRIALQLACRTLTSNEYFSAFLDAP